MLELIKPCHLPAGNLRFAKSLNNHQVSPEGTVLPVWATHQQALSSDGTRNMNIAMSKMDQWNLKLNLLTPSEVETSKGNFQLGRD